MIHSQERCARGVSVCAESPEYTNTLCESNPNESDSREAVCRLRDCSDGRVLSAWLWVHRRRSSTDPNAKKGSGGAPGGGGGKGKGRSLDGGGPVPVVTASTCQPKRDVPIDLQVVGNVEAYSTITVIPQSAGN